ncbi:MAG: isoaspartyl peptidase/L-asparaginase [Polyangiaceae bacterium]
MSDYTLVVERVPLPALVIHGGAGAYLKTTTAAQRLRRGQTLADITTAAHRTFADGGSRAAVLTAMEALENDPSFNAGWGSRLQRDGEARLSAGLMDGSLTRMSAVLNARRCRHPTALADALQARADRNLDGDGARLLMAELGIDEQDVRAPQSLERWRKLTATGDTADREAAIGSAGEEELDRARDAKIAVPDEIAARLEDDENKYGTVGAVAADSDGGIWAATSTGGRGHEAVGRVSDSPTVAGNYACPEVAISATGFGEQIIDLNVCGRIATRVIDGRSLEEALRRTFDEVAAFGGLLGVIAVTPVGDVGYAHTTEACGVAWMDGSSALHVDRHGR